MDSDIPPTKIKGAGHLNCADVGMGPMQVFFDLLALGLLVWLIVGLVMIVLAVRKRAGFKGLAVYAVGAISTATYFAVFQLTLCGLDDTPLERVLRFVRDLAPIVATLVGAGVVAWGIGRLLRPRRAATV